MLVGDQQRGNVPASIHLWSAYSMAAFTDQVRIWAEYADTNTNPVEVWLYWWKYDGRSGAKAYARKITMAFASLRNYERRRVNRRIALEGVPNTYKADTPYMDVICTTAMREKEQAVLVEFFHKDSDKWKGMFDVRGIDEAFTPGQELPDLHQMLREMPREDLTIPDAMKPSHDWMAAIPDDVSPFDEPEGAED